MSGEDVEGPLRAPADIQKISTLAAVASHPYPCTTEPSSLRDTGFGELYDPCGV